MITLTLIDPPVAAEHPAHLSPEGRELIQATTAYYDRVGFQPPWAGYFVFRGEQLVGTGAFTGPPRDGDVEIAYWTFPPFEGQGIATATCRALIDLAFQTDPAVRITAKTAPEQNASTRILQKHGFVPGGVVQDEEIGEAWLWVRP